MNTQTYIEFIPKFITKLENDGISNNIIEVSKWVTNCFKEYCLNNNIKNIDMEVITEFYKKQFGFDIDNMTCNIQTVVRRPLIIMLEYYQDGSYKKTHHKTYEVLVPECFNNIFIKIRDNFINSSNLSKSRKDRKLWTIFHFFKYLENIDITNTKDLKINDVTMYIDTLYEKYSSETIRTIKGVLRETLNWLNINKETFITGNQVFPIIRKNIKEKILTTYTKQEISELLNSIDNSNSSGKCKYAIMSLLVYYGLRVGDIINLKFENVDFKKNYIKIIQQKTKKELTLPLIDEVKFALIDYIRNGRNESKDQEYVFTTLYAPYTKFNSGASIYRMVTVAMKNANINYENKKHGPHSIRHSLATNMINENIPIEDISSVLGHNSTNTTNIYITKDTTHLRELTLEVDYE